MGQDITHISVGREGEDPDATTQPVYVDAPEDDPLDEEPFASGRHRIERLPEGGEDTRPAILWSWTEGDG